MWEQSICAAHEVEFCLLSYIGTTARSRLFAKGHAAFCTKMMPGILMETVESMF
jgi:hypothetical protein